MFIIRINPLFVECFQKLSIYFCNFTNIYFWRSEANSNDTLFENPCQTCEILTDIKTDVGQWVIKRDLNFTP